MVAGFNSRFTPKQVTALAELFNRFEVFQPQIDDNTVAALFACRLKEPLVVCNARILCYIFHCLSKEFLISPIWQAVAAQGKCFISLRGKPISRNTLSSAKYCAVKFDTIRADFVIKDYIHILKNTK